MSKQQLDGILKMAAQNPPPANATPDVMRRWAEGITSHTPLAENVEIERVKVGSFEGDLILPEGGDPSRLIIYYHRGGFFFFSSRTYRVTTTNLARATGSAVFAPDYRLAPENPAPAAHDDAFAVYQSILKQGYAPAKIALSGDSAGGNLALATAVRARDAGLPLPGSLMLLSPWLDFAEEGASYRNTTDDPILPPQVLDGFKLTYLGNGDRKSSKVTPVRCGFARPASDPGPCGKLGTAARRLSGHRRTHEGSRCRCGIENLRRHVPWLATVRADAG
jgi:epsilon-lactone hydrolase